MPGLKPENKGKGIVVEHYGPELDFSRGVYVYPKQITNNDDWREISTPEIDIENAMKIIGKMIERIHDNIKETPPEFIEVIDNNFWELV